MELDSEETRNENPHQLNIRNQIKDAYEEQEHICAMIANYNLDKMNALNDVKRITLLVQEKLLKLPNIITNSVSLERKNLTAVLSFT